MFLAAVPGTRASQEGTSGIFWRALVLSTVLGLAVGGIGGLAVAAGSYTPAVVVDGSGFIAEDEHLPPFTADPALPARSAEQPRRSEAEPSAAEEPAGDLAGNWPNCSRR